MNFAGFLLKKAGWKFVINIPPTPKCIICVAPHTSNWDFILGELCIRSRKMKASFLMKEAWFFFPLGCLLRGIGGIAVSKSHSDVTQNVVDEINNRKEIAVAVTPEGTRSLNANWHHGFLYMAAEAKVPLVLAYIDYKQKVVCFGKIYQMTGDIDADMTAIKQYYKNFTGRYPEKFTTGL
jgi:1-acyl-sn-glycerol-3-phosphate acyltransferase